jgi:hypothetical protein
MAFENVNVTSLKNAIVSCENAINYNSSLELIDAISNDNVWNTMVRNKLNEALSKLINSRYKELENKLNCYSRVALLIEQYKDLEKENISLHNQIMELEPRLYYTESYEVTSIDSKGMTITETRHTTCKDYSVEQQINSASSKIEVNKQKMEELKNKVTLSI